MHRKGNWTMFETFFCTWVQLLSQVTHLCCRKLSLNPHSWQATENNTIMGLFSVLSQLHHHYWKNSATQHLLQWKKPGPTEIACTNKWGKYYCVGRSLQSQEGFGKRFLVNKSVEQNRNQIQHKPNYADKTGGKLKTSNPTAIFFTIFAPNYSSYDSILRLLLRLCVFCLILDNAINMKYLFFTGLLPIYQ